MTALVSDISITTDNRQFALHFTLPPQVNELVSLMNIINQGQRLQFLSDQGGAIIKRVYDAVDAARVIVQLKAQELAMPSVTGGAIEQLSRAFTKALYVQKSSVDVDAEMRILALEEAQAILTAALLDDTVEMAKKKREKHCLKLS